MKRFMFVLGVVAVMAAATSGWTATVAPSQPAETIVQQIQSKDPVQIQQAVTSILNLLQSTNTDDRATAVQGLGQKGHWLAKLREANNPDANAAIIQLAQAATVSVPSDFWLVEYAQDYRARALLASGQPKEALAVAKGLFNVARMKSVAADIAFIVDCLKVAYPSNDAIMDQFRQEQVAGSVLTNEHRTSNTEPPTSNDAAWLLSVAGSRSSVLDGITVDGSDYVTAIQQLRTQHASGYSASTNFTGLVSLGNLLLLADRPKEARVVFDRAYGLAGTNELIEATESIARCIKAEDGTIGRANAWLLSIRP